MSQALSIWLISADEDLSGRWRAALAGARMEVIVRRSADSVDRDLPAGFAGVLVADQNLLGPGAARWFKHLKSRAPGVYSVLAVRDSGADHAETVRCLEAGADDCVPAAIDARVLASKLSAYLRRSVPSAGSRPHSGGGGLRLDRRRRTAWLRSGSVRRFKRADFSPREFDLLCFFADHAGMILERSFILESIWGEEAANMNAATVDKYVQFLRDKLGRHAGLIKTLYSFGYCFG